MDIRGKTNHCVEFEVVTYFSATMANTACTWTTHAHTHTYPHPHTHTSGMDQCKNMQCTFIATKAEIRVLHATSRHGNATTSINHDMVILL